jgi:hypothetical protein
VMLELQDLRGSAEEYSDLIAPLKSSGGLSSGR